MVVVVVVVVGAAVVVVVVVVVVSGAIVVVVVVVAIVVGAGLATVLTTFLTFLTPIGFALTKWIRLTRIRLSALIFGKFKYSATNKNEIKMILFMTQVRKDKIELKFCEDSFYSIEIISTGAAN